MTGQDRIWLEVALNGGWGRERQPLIPGRVDDLISEGISCARAGAAIVHFHAYDDNGVPSDDPGIYAAVIEGIRSEVDAIVYPTIAFEGDDRYVFRSEEHTPELQSLMRISYAVFCLKKQNKTTTYLRQRLSKT